MFDFSASAAVRLHLRTRPTAHTERLLCGLSKMPVLYSIDHQAHEDVRGNQDYISSGKRPRQSLNGRVRNLIDAYSEDPAKRRRGYVKTNDSPQCNPKPMYKANEDVPSNRDSIPAQSLAGNLGNVSKIRKLPRER